MSVQSDTTRLRKDFEKYLMTLKHNRENVSLELLKTKYAAGYKALCSSIKQSASAYLKETVLGDIRIHEDYAVEGIALIQKSIDDSGFLKQLSKAAFHNQNISEFDSLASQLRKKILSDLECLYSQHLGLYISCRCLEEPYPPPEIYCPVNGCILQDGNWIPLKKLQQTEESDSPGKLHAGKQISA